MDEKHLALLERTWAAALERGDAEMLDTLLDREFSAFSWSSRGEILTREDYLSAARATPLSCCAVRGFTFKLVGKVVIARGTLKCECVHDDNSLFCEILVTDVWIERTEGWKAVSRHTSAQVDSLMKSDLTKLKMTIGDASVGQLL